MSKSSVLYSMENPEMILQPVRHRQRDVELGSLAMDLVEAYIDAPKPNAAQRDLRKAEHDLKNGALSRERSARIDPTSFSNGKS